MESKRPRVCLLKASQVERGDPSPLQPSRPARVRLEETVQNGGSVRSSRRDARNQYEEPDEGTGERGGSTARLAAATERPARSRNSQVSDGGRQAVRLKDSQSVEMSERPLRKRASVDQDARAHQPPKITERADRKRDAPVLMALEGPKPKRSHESPIADVTEDSGHKQASLVVDPGATVSFDVCGQLFKVPTQLILERPETLLAQRVESTQNSGAIFVDSDASRFPLILDWYRYDEIHASASVSVEALLLDARNLLLPEELVVNGMVRSTAKPSGLEVARNLVDNVIERWSTFPNYLQGVLDKIQQHYKNIGIKSGKGMPDDEAYDFLPFTLTIYGETGWADPKNVCSAARARVLALTIEERGYLCEFSDADLVVTLKLKLRGEKNAQAAGMPDDLEDEAEPGKEA